MSILYVFAKWISVIGSVKYIHCSWLHQLYLLVQSNTTDNFDEDPPSDFEADYEEDRSKYASEVQDYMDAVNQAAAVNQIAEDLVLLVRL